MSDGTPELHPAVRRAAEAFHGVVEAAEQIEAMAPATTDGIGGEPLALALAGLKASLATGAVHLVDGAVRDVCGSVGRIGLADVRAGKVSADRLAFFGAVLVARIAIGELDAARAELDAVFPDVPDDGAP